MFRLKTKFITDVIEYDTASTIYEVLKDTITWEEGVRSKKGFTRLAKSIDLVEQPELEKIIKDTLTKFNLATNYIIGGVYINYYKDGQMWTPNHSHPKMHQLVISLGATRTLIVNKTSYKMNNGSAIMFGSSVHGVPKENVLDGRISIAVFMISFK